MLVTKNYGTGTDESFAIWWYGAAFDGLNAGSWHATVYQDHTTGFQETPIVNQWYCMTQTFDNITKISNLYKNGLLMSSKTLAGKTILYDTKLLSIGMELQNNVNNFFFPGHIPQVLIYNRALSASEVLQNYNAIKGRYGL